jgi:hypothetical protein
VVLPGLLLFLSNDRNLDSADTWPVIPTAYELVTRGTWQLDAVVDQAPESYRIGGELPYCTLRRGHGIYSSYPAGMVVFALPMVAVASAAGADVASFKVQKHLEKWIASCVAALSLGIFFLLALHLARALSAWLATFLLASGSVMFSTCSQNLWQQTGVVFWVLSILLLEFRQALGYSAGRTLLQGICCAMMLACRLSAAVFILPFGIWLLCRAPRRALAVAVLSAVAYLPWAWLYFSVYGTVLGPSQAQFVGFVWSRELAHAWAGVLFSPSRGILVYQPWLLLLIPAIYFARRPVHDVAQCDVPVPEGWTWLCVTVIALHTGLIAAWNCWWGGNCWGSRLAAEIIPLGALLCARPIAVSWQSGPGRQFVVALALLSFSLHASAMYLRADRWNNVHDLSHDTAVLWSWPDAPFLQPFHRTTAHVRK